MMGVFPYIPKEFGSAPARNNTLTTSTCPFLAAKWIGRSPLTSSISTLAPSLILAITSSTAPLGDNNKKIKKRVIEGMIEGVIMGVRVCFSGVEGVEGVRKGVRRCKKGVVYMRARKRELYARARKRELYMRATRRGVGGLSTCGHP